MDTNILEGLERAAENTPDKPAYVSQQASINWRELRDQAQALGSYFAQRLEPGSPVAILMGHEVWAVPALMGVVYANCFSAPLDPTMPAQRLEKVFDTLQPKYLLCDETAAGVLAELGELPCPVVRYADAVKTPVNQAALDELRYLSSACDPIEVFYTSGSTGIPKGVVHTHRSMLFYAHRVLSWGTFVNERQVWGNQAPFFYSNAIFDLFPAMQLGGTVYLIPSDCFLFPKLFVSYFREKHITTVLMTPLNYLYIADSGVLTPRCLPELESVYICGEAMPYRPMRMWAEAAAPGAGIFNFYGSTECPYNTCFVLEDRVMEPGEIVPSGLPLRGVKLLVLDDNGEPLPRGQVGELYVTAPWISSGYYNDPQRTAATFVSDPLNYGYVQLYYRTGDLGWLDENGELHVKGRKDTQIKHRGYRMDLGEVEAALRATEGWQNGCCLFHEAEDKLYCFWCGTLTEQALKAQLAAKLEKYMLPNVYVHLDPLPRTTSGKLDRMALKRSYFQG